MVRKTVRSVQVPDGSVLLDADLQVPAGVRALIVFAHGSGSSRFSGRNRQVAAALNEARFATLVLDLLTPREESLDRFTGEYRFDIPRLGRRVIAGCDWARSDAELSMLPIGCFGASTGAAAALIAAAERPEVSAVVSRGGRPDLAGDVLPRVQAPTLLIVGGDDTPVIGMNEDARRQMTTEVTLEIVPGATHLFEEPGALERVSELAIQWFDRHVVPSLSGRRRSLTSDTIAVDRWNDVLHSFSREHRAWLARVERDGVAVRERDRPLAEVSAEERGGQVVAIRVAFDEGSAPAEIRVERPVAVSIDREGGMSTGLHIEDAGGHHTTVRFRVPAPAEILDGVAPGEV